MWTHVAVVHTPDGDTATYGGVDYPTGTVEFYVDGVRWAPPSAWNPPRLPNIDASVSSNLYNLGQSRWGCRSISGACGNCSFVGSMRDVYLWNAALTPTEVDALRLSNTLPATTPDPPSRTPILATGITNQYICEQTPPSPPPLPSPPPPSAPPLSPPSASPSPPPRCRSPPPSASPPPPPSASPSPPPYPPGVPFVTFSSGADCAANGCSPLEAADCEDAAAAAGAECQSFGDYQYYVRLPPGCFYWVPSFYLEFVRRRQKLRVQVHGADAAAAAARRPRR